MSELEKTFVAVDGLDALAYVIIKPNGTGDGVIIDAGANGMSKEQGAYILRHVANQWSTPEVGTPDDRAAYIAMLEDSVIAAACLWFGEVPAGSQADYLSEGLHGMASELVRTVPRLNGAFKGVDDV